MKFYILDLTVYHSTKHYVRRYERYKFFKLKEDAYKHLSNRMYDELNKVSLDIVPDELIKYYVDGKINEIYKDHHDLMDDIQSHFDELHVPCYLIYNIINEYDTDDIE
jgi:hypothetical protein